MAYCLLTLNTCVIFLSIQRVPGMVLGQVLDSEEIKVEDGSSSIRPDLVKQGKHLILRDPPTSEDNVIIQWNVEQMDSENIPGTGKYIQV